MLINNIIDKITEIISTEGLMAISFKDGIVDYEELITDFYGCLLEYYGDELRIIAVDVERILFELEWLFFVIKFKDVNNGIQFDINCSITEDDGIASYND